MWLSLKYLEFNKNVPHERIRAVAGGDYNIIGILGGTYFKSVGSEILTSKYEFTYNDGLQIQNTEQFIINFTANQLTNKFHGNISNLSDSFGAKGAVKGLEHVFKIGSSSTIGLFSSYFKDN